jgi:membrane protein DedA with SNARE-associated domain
MTVDCDTMKTVLTVLWAVIGAAVAGPIGYALARRRQSSKEFVYRGPGGDR